MSEKSRLGQIRGKRDRREICIERELAASAAEVWAALTEPAQLAEWFATAKLEPRVGGTIELAEADGSWRMTGTIRAFEPPRLLEYDWEDAHQTSIVRFELEPLPGGRTRLSLSERVLSDVGVVRRSAGWHHNLERLERKLRGESGVADRRRWRELLALYEKQL